MMSALQNTSFDFPQQVYASQPTYARKPYGDISDFVKQLTVDFSNYFGDPVNASFDLRPGRVLTYNVSGLSKAGQWFAKKALAAWSATTGITFKHVKASNADINFVQNDNSGAYATTQYNSKGDIVKAKVNIPPSWYQGEEYDLGSYGYQTFLHEIGHALGLGHAGNYNGTGGFAGDARFSNDSWQMTVMSYFSQTENPNVTGSFAYILTPMPADIAAIHKLYGIPKWDKKVNPWKTTWGFNSNAEGPAKEFAKIKPVGAMTIFDQGGHDTIDFSKTSANQKISLVPGSFSNVLGKVKNVQIESNTMIEDVKSGRGKDLLNGNDLGNTMFAGGKADVVYGRKGTDFLFGQDGWDDLQGGDGNDYLYGGNGSDKLSGGSGNDRLKGNAGNDKLLGGSGTDRLDGGFGNDTLTGGADADTFVFEHGGNDRITDFNATEGDTIQIDRDLVWTSNVTTFLTNHAKVVGSNVVISVAKGYTLTVEGVTDPMELVDDITFI